MKYIDNPTDAKQKPDTYATKPQFHPILSFDVNERKNKESAKDINPQITLNKGDGILLNRNLCKEGL